VKRIQKVRLFSRKNWDGGKGRELREITSFQFKGMLEERSGREKEVVRAGVAEGTTSIWRKRRTIQRGILGQKKRDPASEVIRGSPLAIRKEYKVDN